jgi:chloride channel protein, CIC family
MTHFRIVLVSVLAAGIGVIAGLVAFALYHLIGLFTNVLFFHRVRFDLPSLANQPLGWGVIPLAAAGGLAVGLMAKFGSEKIRGHGIPEAMEAVMFNRSRISPKVAILKPLSAAIAIGSGGPFGAEGPIIQTGGAFGSAVGQVLHVTAAERKVLLACGAAAGMAATFSAPIAAVILAVELLIFEFKTRSFVPLVQFHRDERTRCAHGAGADVRSGCHGFWPTASSADVPAAGRDLRAHGRWF